MNSIVFGESIEYEKDLILRFVSVDRCLIAIVHDQKTRNTFALRVCMEIAMHLHSLSICRPATANSNICPCEIYTNG